MNSATIYIYRTLLFITYDDRRVCIDVVEAAETLLPHTGKKLKNRKFVQIQILWFSSLIA
jgi:hypothetical protein